MNKMEEIKAVSSLIEQFEEDSDSTTLTFNCMILTNFFFFFFCSFSLFTNFDFTAMIVAEEENKAKVIKVTLGNDLDLLDTEDSSGKTAGEVQKVINNSIL